MWLTSRLVVKAFTVAILSFFLVLLRKVILSVDIRMLHWFIRDLRFPDYQGQAEGFLNSGLGEIKYNITNNTLTKITTEFSEINASSLWSFPGTGPSYLNISFHNGNASFEANWSYSMWPSLGDQGELTLDLNNATLTFAVKIFTDAHGLVNFTVIDCAMYIGAVDIDLKNTSGLIYDSIKSAWQTRAEESLGDGLCKALRYGVENHTSLIIRNAQLQFVAFILPANLGWIFTSVFPISVKIIHDFGVTLLLMFALVSLYLFSEMIRSGNTVSRLSAIFHPKRRKLRRMSDRETDTAWRRTNTGLTTSVNLNGVVDDLDTTQNDNRFLSRWWKRFKKTKEN